MRQARSVDIRVEEADGTSRPPQANRNTRCNRAFSYTSLARPNSNDTLRRQTDLTQSLGRTLMYRARDLHRRQLRTGITQSLFQRGQRLVPKWSRMRRECQCQRGYITADFDVANLPLLNNTASRLGVFELGKCLFDVGNCDRAVGH